jgi:predicted small secreted protein
MLKKILLLSALLITATLVSGCGIKDVQNTFSQLQSNSVFKQCADAGGEMVVTEDKDGNTEQRCDFSKKDVAATNSSSSAPTEVAPSDQTAPTEATSTEDVATSSIKIDTALLDSTSTKKEVKEITPNVFTIDGKANETGVALTWDFGTTTASVTYRVLRSVDPNPTYPSSDYRYIINNQTKNYVWSVLDGKNYYYRVCLYLNRKCQSYTDSLKITSPVPSVSKNTTTSTAQIILSGTVDGSTIKLNWDIGDGKAPDGYKLLISPKVNPVYPGSEYKYFSGQDTKNYDWKNLKPGTDYHFRVCIYKSTGVCGTYSNDLLLTTDKTPISATDAGSASSTEQIAAPVVSTASTPTTAIVLSGESSGGQVKLTWTADGASPQGYKVVMAKIINPTYPGNSYYHYFSSSAARADVWDASEVKVGTTYHFRVCVYATGACGLYSNDAEVTVK